MRTLLRATAIGALSLLMSACATVGPSAPLGVGDWVLARWQDDDAHYWPAVIDARNGDTVSLRYDDGDVGMQHIANVRPFDWRVGSRLECRWQDGTTFFSGRIERMNEDRVHIEVAYDDGDKEATDTSRCREVS